MTPPLCTTLSQAGETLDLAACIIEDATELPQPPEHCREVVEQLGALLPVIFRAMTALEAIGRGALTREAIARLE
jgi:hypothetical protein